MEKEPQGSPKCHTCRCRYFQVIETCIIKDILWLIVLGSTFIVKSFIKENLPQAAAGLAQSCFSCKSISRNVQVFRSEPHEASALASADGSADLLVTFTQPAFSVRASSISWARTDSTTGSLSTFWDSCSSKHCTAGDLRTWTPLPISGLSRGSGTPGSGGGISLLLDGWSAGSASVGAQICEWKITT